MHFSIPDSQEITQNGSSFTGFNIHVNGVFHCTVRYSQLLTVYDRIRKDYPAISSTLPRFPPKKLLPLSIAQLEDRRLLLERFIQAVGQDSKVSECELFQDFLLAAQLQTHSVVPETKSLDVFLTNGFRITLDAKTNQRTDSILKEVADRLSLPQELCSYFCLYLEKIEDGELLLYRRLLDFESPYISLTTLQTLHRIVLRKNYWDSSLDLTVMENKVGLNLLYLQTVCDVERGWLICSKDHLLTLATLQSQGNKRKYMEVARTLKFYGYLHFKQCTCDYPYPGSRVIVAAGNKELNLRVKLSHDDDIRQGCFKVTRMRCWRITTLHGDGNETPPSLELSFEYLMARNKLQWITICSEQAVLMSMCLQTMVEELLDESQTRNSKSTDASSSSDMTPSTPGPSMPSTSEVKRSDSKHTVTYNPAKSIVRNECFANDGIGDDDL